MSPAKRAGRSPGSRSNARQEVQTGQGLQTVTRQLRCVCFVAATILVGGLLTVAQSRLDVVSVRENPARRTVVDHASRESRPGRLDLINLSLQELVEFGYGIGLSPLLRDALVVGWP